MPSLIWQKDVSLVISEFLASKNYSQMLIAVKLFNGFNVVYRELTSNCCQKKVLIGHFRICSNLFWVLKFQNFITTWVCPLNLIAKTASPQSRCVGSEPGIHENLAQLEMSTIRNELSVEQHGIISHNDRKTWQPYTNIYEMIEKHWNRIWGL